MDCYQGLPRMAELATKVTMDLPQLPGRPDFSTPWLLLTVDVLECSRMDRGEVWTTTHSY